MSGIKVTRIEDLPGLIALLEAAAGRYAEEAASSTASTRATLAGFGRDHGQTCEHLRNRLSRHGAALGPEAPRPIATSVRELERRILALAAGARRNALPDDLRYVLLAVGTAATTHLGWFDDRAPVEVRAA